MFKIVECWYYPEKMIDIVNTNPINKSVGYAKIINNEVVEIKGEKTNLFYTISSPKGAVRKIEYSKILYVVFDFDSAELKGSEKKKIDTVKEDIINHKTSMMVECHTDNVGDSKYNMSLSRERAQVVADYISEKYDVDRINIIARGCGDKQPIYSNDTKESSRKNNRIEISFMRG